MFLIDVQMLFLHYKRYLLITLREFDKNFLKRLIVPFLLPERLRPEVSLVEKIQMDLAFEALKILQCLFHIRIKLREMRGTLIDHLVCM